MTRPGYKIMVMFPALTSICLCVNGLRVNTKDSGGWSSLQSVEQNLEGAIRDLSGVVSSLFTNNPQVDGLWRVVSSNFGTTTTHQEDDPATTYQHEDDPATTYQHEDDPATTYQHEDDPATIYHHENDSATTHLEDNTATIYQHEDDPATIYHHENDSATTHLEDNTATIYHHDDDPATTHLEDNTATTHLEDDTATTHLEDNTATTHLEDNTVTTHHVNEDLTTERMAKDLSHRLLTTTKDPGVKKTVTRLQQHVNNKTLKSNSDNDQCWGVSITTLNCTVTVRLPKVPSSVTSPMLVAGGDIQKLVTMLVLGVFKVLRRACVCNLIHIDPSCPAFLHSLHTITRACDL